MIASRKMHSFQKITCSYITSKLEVDHESMYNYHDIRYCHDNTLAITAIVLQVQLLNGGLKINSYMR